MDRVVLLFRNYHFSLISLSLHFSLLSLVFSRSNLCLIDCLRFALQLSRTHLFWLTLIYVILRAFDFAVFSFPCRTMSCAWFPILAHMHPTETGWEATSKIKPDDHVQILKTSHWWKVNGVSLRLGSMSRCLWAGVPVVYSSDSMRVFVISLR